MVRALDVNFRDSSIRGPRAELPAHVTNSRIAAVPPPAATQRVFKLASIYALANVLLVLAVAQFLRWRFTSTARAFPFRGWLRLSAAWVGWPIPAAAAVYVLTLLAMLAFATLPAR